MTLNLLDDMVLIRRDAAETKSAGGVHLPERDVVRPLRGTVLAVGPGRATTCSCVDRVPLIVKPGDVVLYGRYAGQDLRLDGDDCLVLREAEIFGVIEAEHRVVRDTLGRALFHEPAPPLNPADLYQVAPPTVDGTFPLTDAHRKSLGLKELPAWGPAVTADEIRQLEERIIAAGGVTRSDLVRAGSRVGKTLPPDEHTTADGGAAPDAVDWSNATITPIDPNNQHQERAMSTTTDASFNLLEKLRELPRVLRDAYRRESGDMSSLFEGETYADQRRPRPPLSTRDVQTYELAIRHAIAYVEQAHPEIPRDPAA